MASIDKTYFSSVEQYREIKEWCESVGVVHDKFGNTFSPIDYMAEYEYAELETLFSERNKKYIEENISEERWRSYNKIWEDWLEKYPDDNFAKSQIVNTYDEWKDKVNSYRYECFLWNTPTFFDLYLIKNCPVEFIQERLKEQYAADFIESVLQGTSEYDTFNRDKIALKTPHFKLPNEFNRMKNEKVYIIDIHHPEYGYCVYKFAEDKWHFDIECNQEVMYNNDICYIYGRLTEKNLKRIIKNWKLPKDTVITIDALRSNRRIEIKLK